MKVKNNFLEDFKNLLDSYETLLVSEGQESFVDLQLILFHLRQISSIYLKHREFDGVTTTASFEIRKKLSDIGSIPIVPREENYSIVNFHDATTARG